MVIDIRYKGKIPDFISKQTEALTLAGSAAGRDVSVTYHYIDGLNNRLESAVGSAAQEKAAEAFKLEMVSLGKTYGTNLVASILPPKAWATMNDGDLGGEGFAQPHIASGTKLMFSCNNTRALAHEYYHGIGYSTGFWTNTPPFNFVHNNKFNNMMDSVGVPPTSFPQDY
ncbi:MAG: hypothetical protein Q8O00_05270 [Holophaga sp.]|nr:hypothetical protein [Holophaga sp.]